MRLLFLLLGCLPLGVVAQKVPTFQDDVVPIFKEHCNGCHNADKLKGDLDLTSHATVIKGGSSGVVVKPGAGDTSLLYQAMAHTEEPAMPPKKPKLDDAVLQVVKLWIDGGCKETVNSEAAKSRDAALSAAMAAPSAENAGPGAMPSGLAVLVDKSAKPQPILAMAASPRAPLLAISRSSYISFLNSDSLEPLGDIPNPEHTAHVVKFSPTGDLLLVAGGRGAHSGTAVLYEVKSGKPLTKVGDDASDSVLSADISSDQQRVACGSTDKLVAVYDVKSGKKLFAIKKHTDWVTAVAFSPRGDQLATGDRAGGLHLWDAKTGTILYTLAEHQGRITALSWRADGAVLASAGDDGKLILWDTVEGWAARSVNPSTKQGKGSTAKFPGVLSAQFGPDGKIAITTRDKIARILSAQAAQLAQSTPFTSLPTATVIPWDGKSYVVADMAGGLVSAAMPLAKK